MHTKRAVGGACRARPHAPPTPHPPHTHSPARHPQPVGGHMLAHYVHVRVHLRKGKGNQRIAKIYAGPLPEEEATFALTENGVVDAE